MCAITTHACHALLYCTRVFAVVLQCTEAAAPSPKAEHCPDRYKPKTRPGTLPNDAVWPYTTQQQRQVVLSAAAGVTTQPHLKT
jgi:hypothetical protein